MKRYGLIAYLIFAVLYVVGEAGLAFTAAWTMSERLWAVVATGFFVGLAIVIPAAFAALELENTPHQPRLRRAERKVLADERQRIALERKIREMEREAGL